MATKNLARTVVEGGRSGHSKFDRRLRNRSERRLRFDEEDDVIRGKVRNGGYREFNDRLSPLERWLDRNVGRGWNNVYREFCERFDRRTMKGWHLRDHLRQMVARDRFDWWRFYVDERGILRRVPRRRWPKGQWVSSCERQRAVAWAAGRRVIAHGDALFWTARRLDNGTSMSPQGRRLTAEEVEVWCSLPGTLQTELRYVRPLRHGTRIALFH